MSKTGGHRGDLRRYQLRHGAAHWGAYLSPIRRELGMVFQNFNLFPHMTVLENVIEAPFPRLCGVPGRATTAALARGPNYALTPSRTGGWPIGGTRVLGAALGGAVSYSAPGKSLADSEATSQSAGGLGIPQKFP